MASTRRCLLLVVLALAAAALGGCSNKCDELVTTLTDCVGSDVGASDTAETDNTRADTECGAEDEQCASCVLAAKLDLCTDYGAALAQCQSSGDCQ